MWHLWIFRIYTISTVSLLFTVFAKGISGRTLCTWVTLKTTEESTLELKNGSRIIKELQILHLWFGGFKRGSINSIGGTVYEANGFWATASVCIPIPKLIVDLIFFFPKRRSLIVENKPFMKASLMNCCWLQLLIRTYSHCTLQRV